MYLEVNQELGYLDSISIANVFIFYANHFTDKKINSVGFNNDYGYAYMQLESDLFNYSLILKSFMNNNDYIQLTHTETEETITFDNFQEYKNFIIKEGELDD